MGLCVVLAVATIKLAVNEIGQPWAGFDFNKYAVVMQANDTGLVFFDKIVDVVEHPLQTPHERGSELRRIMRSTPPGTPLTYNIMRDGQFIQQTVPVQTLTHRDLAASAGIPIFVGLGQLTMGALVFLLRPNTRRSWIFLAFCMAWFGLCTLLYDFASTSAFDELFQLCWYLTSALMLHLAMTFPEERQVVRSHPRVQLLIYLPSLLLWGFDRSIDSFFSGWYAHHLIAVYGVYTHTVYWMATFVTLLLSLIHTALRASSAVARRRAGTVFAGFAAGFLLPIGAESAALLFHLNLPLQCLWLLTLFLPLSITYATLRYNLFDASVIMRRSLTYGLLSGVVILAYLLSIKIFNTILQDVPVSQARGFPILFGLGVLFVIHPLRERIQRLIDRVFFRTRYDFRQTIESLSQDLTTLLDLDDIAQRIVHTIAHALGVSRAALLLKADDDTYQVQAAAGHPTSRLMKMQPPRDHPLIELIAQRSQGLSRYDLEANPALARQVPDALGAFDHLAISLALPIRFKDDLMGLLAIGEKRSGVIFTEADLDLLRTLTNQSAIALANARSYRSLEATNAQLRSALRKVELLETVKTHLDKFVPASVRRLIEHNPTAPALDKHEQDVSVLFLDIAGYTSLSEALDQDKVNYLVERYFSSFLDDIYTNQGDINETAGDGLMIIFQDDNPQAHACAAVQTALAIREKTAHINAELQGLYEPVTVNMGINSGTAAVGSTKFEGATGTRWTFTASGPVTNLASRLGASATHGAIYIGEATAQRLSGEFEKRALDPQQFKNVNGLVEVCEILGMQRLQPALAAVS
jgi:class 3 adenylate cyclase